MRRSAGLTAFLVGVCRLALPGPCSAADGWHLVPEVWSARETLAAKTPGASYAAWRESGLAGHARRADGRLYSLRWRETERFGLADRETGLALHLPLGDGWAADADAAMSGTHRVLARHTLAALVERRLAGGWGVQGGFRRSQYDVSRTDLRQLTVDRYFGAQRAAYTYYSAQPEGGGAAPSHRLQWSYYLASGGSFGASAAAGRETDIVAPGVLATNDIRDYAVFVRHAFAAGWSASAEAFSHDQGNLYRRHGFRVGAQLHF